MMVNTRRILAIVSALALAIVGSGISPASARAGASVPAINNADRAQVAATYLSAIDENLEINHQWTGSTDPCTAGSASNAYDAATIESINWFRSMAGLQPVTENTRLSVAAQQTALMMHAQNDLSHAPPRQFKCFTTAGAAAAGVSNLTLGSAVVGVRGVLGQIEELGDSNANLGHRRWLLNPQLTTVGVANTSRASVVNVINDFGARESETPWVAWPPPGFVPDETIYNRWSMSYAGTGNIDFSNATVTVSENGRQLPVKMLPLFHNFGDPTLGWEVNTANPTAAGDVVYEVVVTNMVLNGRQISRRYRVTSFDASAPVGSATAPLCNGLRATIVGTSGDDVLQGTSDADVIVGLGGNDTIDGFAGNDVICGGAGSDTLRGGWGDDRVYGGQGPDILRGANGRDILNGGAGRDNLHGGPGADTLVGGAHSDTLVGNLGRDVCWGRVVNQSVATNDTRLCEAGR